jgi:hypothetical protein
MHDIDRTYMEFEDEGEAFQPEAFEFEEESEVQPGRSNGGVRVVLDETDEMELAMELLEVSDEAELDRFIGNLISKAGRAAGRFISSPTGQALGGILKGAAAQALPMVGSAIGGYFGGSAGQKAGGQVASALGKAVGLELESLNPEDREFEVARGLVRFGAEAVRKAAEAGPGNDPRAAARKAAVQAAQAIAPGLLQSGGMAGGTGRATNGRAASGQARSGRWVRRGSRIVLHGV